MGEVIKEDFVGYTPTGLVDSIDGNFSRKGAMSSLGNLMPSPSTPGLFIPRPAAFPISSFPGLSSPGYVSVHKSQGNRLYGMVASSLNAGYDQPFVYDIVAQSEIAVSGITSGNVPLSPPTTGAWTPPTVSFLGGWVIVTHPGFDGVTNFFGWFDITGFNFNTGTGTTQIFNTVINSLSFNPLVVGVTVGMTISDSAGDIPAGSRVTAVNGSGSTGVITISNTMTGGHSSNTLTIAGGTYAAPLWNAGNTNITPLPSVPVTSTAFFDRIYFGCSNVLFYTDVLNPLNITNATNQLTLLGEASIVATTGQPFFTTQSGGIVASLLAFKKEGIWQVTGDLSLNTLSLNQLSDGVGTDAPRSLANTPLGVMFLASDGVRTVDLNGNVNPPNLDLTTPFLSTTVPSRVTAAYSVGVYRICSWSIIAGVTVPQSYWYDTVRSAWIGPHTLVFDCISTIGSGTFPNDETFLVSGSGYPGQLLQSNVLPGPSDMYVELGVDLSWIWQTAVMPEIKPMVTVSIAESALFMEVRNSIGIAGTVFDQSNVALATTTITTPILAPSNARNWLVAWTPTGGNAGANGIVTIPNRSTIQFSGPSTPGLAIGTLFMKMQWTRNANSTDPAAISVPSSIDLGSVTDDVLTATMDWGRVIDPVFASIDFETAGTIVPGPP